LFPEISLAIREKSGKQKSGGHSEFEKGRKTPARQKMVERYRNHLIFVKADQDPATALWRAGTHIQFNEDPRTFRDIWLPRPTVGFKTKRNAEKQRMKEARKWVDDRLRQGKTTETPSLDSDLLVSGEKNALAEPHEKDEPPLNTSSARAE
jgi:hypothetical protein